MAYDNPYLRTRLWPQGVIEHAYAQLTLEQHGHLSYHRRAEVMREKMRELSPSFILIHVDPDGMENVIDMMWSDV